MTALITTPEALLDALRARGLMAADTDTGTSAAAPAVPHDAAPERPWYIALLLGASGWIAGVFMLVFVALLFQPDTAPSAALAGVVLLGAAWGLFRVDRHGSFVTQLALAFSIAGQCLVVFAFSRDSQTLVSASAGALVLQVLLALVMPNPLHRTLSALFATIAWALLWRSVLVGDVRWDVGLRARPVAPAPALAAWLLTWLPIGATIAQLIRTEPAWMARRRQPVLRPILGGLIVGLAFATLASEPFETLRAFGDGALQTNGLALWPLLSALGALGALAAAFALRHRGLIGACVVALLLHVSQFYDVLGVSLLWKSLLMLLLGAALLLAARALTAKEPA